MSIVGSTEEIILKLTNPKTKAPEDAPEGTITLSIVDPEGTETLVKESEAIEKAATGEYVKLWLSAKRGLYHYRWMVEGKTADEGTWNSESDFIPEGLEPDLHDLRVLLPKGRRKIEGPWGNPNGRPEIPESYLYAMIADAAGEMLLLAGSWWRNELKVKSRDPLGGFPVEWKTLEPLSEWEASVICCQLALDYYTFLFRDLKTSQAIKNEGTEWTYTISANLLRNYMISLKEERDEAIAGLRRNTPVLDRMASNIRVRDQATVAVLEWWDYNSPGLSGSGMPGGQEATSIPWFPGGGDYSP